MEHSHRHAPDTESHHHVTELRDRGVRENAFNVRLRDRNAFAERYNHTFNWSGKNFGGIFEGIVSHFRSPVFVVSRNPGRQR